MKKGLRKVIMLIIAVMALSVCFVFGASAETEYTEGYYTYIVEDGKATIVDVDESISGDVVIPDMLGGYEVTAIGDGAFYFCTSLANVEIPDSVTLVGNWAFQYCENLKNIIIPDSIISIGDYVFNFCDSLTKVEIPDSVSSIGESAFSHCENLTEIIVDGSNKYYSNDENGILYNKEKTVLVQYLDGKKWSYYSIPDGITTIKAFAFDDCDNLESIKIPDSITSIEEKAFYNTDHWFESVHITDLAAWCNIDFGGINQSNAIESADFYLNGNLITDLVIPEEVTVVKPYTFFSCKNLKSVVIHDDVTDIGEYAFAGCGNIESVTIGKSTTNIGAYSFSHCTNLANITISDSVINIGFAAFYACNNLSDIFYMGTYEQWDSIDVSVMNDPLYAGSGTNFHFAIDGHIFGEWYRENNPACTVDGNDRRDCLYCSEYEISVVPATGHTFGEWFRESEPACETAGNDRRDCLNCLEYEVKAVPETGHTFGEWYRESEPTCKREGNDRRDCINCSERETRPVGVISHNMNGEYVRAEPTCTDKGVLVTYCTECGYEQTSALDKIPHSDADGDGNCDSCGRNIAEANCTCNCHKGGFMSFIWKIIRFFQKLFRTNQFCACGVAHY